MCTFALFFQPKGLRVTNIFESIRMLPLVNPEMRKLGMGAIPYDGGLQPWEWVEDEKPSFRALQGQEQGPEQGKGGFGLEWIKKAIQQATANGAGGQRKGQGKLLCAPILRKLIFNREPKQVLDWANKVSQWPIKRIIPAHFSNNLQADGKAFRRAFSFLESNNNTPATLNNGASSSDPMRGTGDMRFLESISQLLTRQNVLLPEAPLV